VHMTCQKSTLAAHAMHAIQHGAATVVIAKSSVFNFKQV
jgi:hypothetical protein